MKAMEGITIKEMAKRIGVPYKTVSQRILRGGYEPIFSGNLYTMDVFEAIKDVPGKGRPKKEPESKDKPAKKGKK